jgi:ferritin
MVKQIAHELKNYNLYKSYANYFSVEGIVDLDEYYHKRAHEENLHHNWLVDYLSAADFKFTYPTVEQNTEKFSTYIEPFTQTVDREIQTTEMIYSIYKQCQLEGDYMTCSWLYEKLIKEQIEEENITRMARTIMEETSDIFLRAKQVLKLLNP